MLKKYESLAYKKQDENNINNLTLDKPSQEEVIKLTNETKKALEEKISGKIKSSGMSNDGIQTDNSVKYIRYTPNQQGFGHNSGAGQRIIRISQTPQDPLEQPKFKHKRIPGALNEEPVPVMHSLSKKITREDQLAWNIPPCVSNWKNAKGFTIPLEMRLSADGRNLKNFSVSEKFSKFADVLYITEKQARKEIEERNKLQESIKIMDNIKKEKELRDAAKDAREKKIALAVSNISSVMTNKTDDTEILLGKKANRFDHAAVSIEEQRLEDEKLERNKLRNIRKKEIERDRRIEVAGNKKAKLTRDLDRDISEKIALGQAQPSKESMIDARLYNQTTGLESGFKEEEDYDLYDKPLFVDRTSASIYKNVRAGSSLDDDTGNNDITESRKLMEKIYKRSNMFEGADINAIGNKGGKPIEFERTEEEYGLNDIHKKKKK